MALRRRPVNERANLQRARKTGFKGLVCRKLFSLLYHRLME
jgi:hypothetical protein